MSVRQPEAGFKPGAPPRTHISPSPTTRTIVVPIDGPVDRFARLVDAVAAADYLLATRVRRELYRRGWSIIPPRSPFWRGGPDR